MLLDTQHGIIIVFAVYILKTVKVKLMPYISEKSLR